MIYNNFKFLLADSSMPEPMPVDAVQDDTVQATLMQDLSAVHDVVAAPGQAIKVGGKFYLRWMNLLTISCKIDIIN